MKTAIRRAAVSLCASTLLLTVACAAEGADAASAEEADAAEEGPSAALTTAEAKEVLDRYAEIYNEASEELDVELVATAEAGSLLQRSTAELDFYRSLPEEDLEPYEPFSYEEPEFFIPAGGEPWFMVAATTTRSDDVRLLTFATGEAGGGEAEGEPWRMVSALTLWEDEVLPEVALDDEGFATAAPADEPTEPLRPEQIGTAVTDLLVTGGVGWGGQLAENAVVEESLEEHAYLDRELSEDLEYARYTGSYQADDPEHPEVYSLRTADGGLLTVAPRAHTLREGVTRSGANLVPSEQVSVYVEENQPTIRSFVVGEVLAHLPPDDAPRALATATRLVDAV